MKVKHNKYKNTGILFELLVRKITSDAMNNSNSKAASLVKKYFTKSELANENKLYQIINNSISLSESKAESVLSTVLDLSKKLDKDQLSKEKYNLIKEVKESFDMVDFFQAKIKNYKLLASTYILLESHNNRKFANPESIITSKITILEHITSNPDTKMSLTPLVEDLMKLDKGTRALTYKLMLEKYNTKFEPHEIAPILRGLLTENTDQKFILNYRSNKTLEYFINGKDVRRYSSVGTATPDHVIRVKPFPLVITPKKNSNIEDFKKIAEKSFKDYRKKYVRYFDTNKKKVKDKKTMLDTSPRVILVQNVGLFSVGDSLSASKIAGDLTETNARVISSVEETTKYKFIPEKDLFDVEYWSLEQAKIRKVKKTLQGNVVVITGGFGAIGSATYKLFKSHGAEIVLLDYDSKKVKEMQSKIKDLCLHCDVRNKNSVKKAFKKICEQYGGIDILISNAGTAIGGSIAEVDDNILRESFEDNFFSHQNCASETIKIMKKQNIQGCLLFNISKQSVNPGKNFGPYGLPKTALLSLCKQYAVDYGSLGIRSNGVNADRIRSGLLNDGMIKSRAKAREVSTDEYMRGNLLLNEVKAEDVAKAFFHLAVSKKTTGAVLTVDGGNIAASLR